MGFEPQIREIVEKHGMPTKENRQTMMFSATFPEQCQKLAQDYLYNYIWIGVGIVGGAVDTVDQSLVKVTTKDKYQKLVETVDRFFKEKRNGASTGKDQPRALVFCNAKDTAKWLDEQLYELKIDTGALHGNLTQQERETNLSRFRDGKIDVMIATDVAARGLDIENVALVINYDMPSEIDSYIHRIGRTGRIGNRGEAITFISCDDSDLCLENVETLKSLLQVMRDAKCQLPDWLEGLIETTSAAKTGGSWKWGGKDVRGGTAEAYRGTGGGDAWSDWKKKSDDNGGDNSWNKESSWDPKEDAAAAWEKKDDAWKSW
jgi:superfamily II DNA/RNA helicase